MPNPKGTRPTAGAPPKIVSSIKIKLEEDLKKRLKAPSLSPEMSKIVDSPEMSKIIDETATTVAGTLTKQYVTKKALQVGKELFRDGDHAKAIGDRLSSALKGVQLVSQSADLKKMLEENAKMLFAKKKALVDAGFADTEAFQLILAEVTAKKSK
jgi:hypothetical protein